VLPELAVRRPDLLLETDGDGAGNWQMPGDSEEEEDGAASLPTIGALEVEEATFAYVDGAGDSDLSATIASLTGQSDDARLVLSGEGEVQDVPFRLEIVAGAAAALQRGQEPYPIDLDLSLGSTEVAVSGTVERLADLAGLDLSIAIEGPDLAELGLIDAIAVPSTPSYALSGSLARDGDTWRLAEFEGRLGESDLGGTVTVDLGAEPPAVEADLVADVLDVAELRAIFGIPPPDEIIEAAAADDGLIAPDDRLDVALLGAANGRVSLSVKRLVAPTIPPLDDLAAELNLDGVVLRAQPLVFGVGGGEVRTFVSLYGDKDPMGIDLLAYVRDVSLKELFRGTEFVEEMAGKLDGRTRLTGLGNTWHEMLSGADGDIELVMSEGQVSGLLIELIGLDIAEALGLYLGDDTQVPIRCLVADLAIEAGVVKSRTLLLDTTDTLITGTGQLDLATETIDLSLTPEPKDVSFLSLRSTVSVEGRLADLSVAPDLASILRLLPPIDLGTAENAPCAQMLERARQDYR
jgi:uncharacterized protein involved in outer membrane biogenesis